MKRSVLSLLLLTMLIFIAACGGASEEPAAVGTTPAAPAETQAEQPTSAPTATPVPPTSTPEAEDEPLDAEQLAALEALDSYRLVVNYSSKGTDADGNPIDDSGEIIVEYTKDPPARRMVIGFVTTQAGGERWTPTNFGTKGVPFSAKFRTSRTFSPFLRAVEM